MMIYRKHRFLLLLSALLLVAGTTVFATFDDEEKQQREFEEYYKIYSLATPPGLTFAGEQVPMTDADVKERFDKELLTNVYWQSQTLLMIKRANRFFPAIEKILRQNNIPEDFKYLAVAESGLQFNVISPSNAVSYWQFLEKTGKVYGLEINEEVDERYHIEKATLAACRYFKEAYREFNNWSLVAASYNMGIDGVRRQVAAQGVSNYYDLYLNMETSRYVLRILAIKEILERPYKYGFRLTREHLYNEMPSVKIRVSRSIPDIAHFALDNGCTYKDLKLLNPWIKKMSLNVPPGKTYYIVLPKSKISATAFASKVINDTIDMSETEYKDSIR